jgi:hypothetical protein
MKKIIKKSSTGGKNHPEVKSHVTLTNNKTHEVVHEHGLPVESESKTVPISEGTTAVGLCKGVTLSMGNYQSARIDCWITSPCKENDRSKQDMLSHNSALIDEQIEFETEQLTQMVQELGDR